METAATELIREAMLSDAAAPIDEAELGKCIEKFREVINEVWRERPTR